MYIYKAAVIGAGTMGRGIAQVFAQGGFDVGLYDADPAVVESATAHIHRMLDRAVEKGRMAAADAAATKKRLHPFTNLSDLGPCELVVEAIIENLEAKVEVLRSVRSLVTDESLIASNTSSISITRLAAATDRPERFIGMHFFNPVPLMKLVEVVRGLQTSDDTVERTVALAKTIAEKPPLAIVGTKEMLNYARDHTIADGLNHIATWQAGMFRTDDLARQLAANKAKTPAAFDDLLPPNKYATKGL